MKALSEVELKRGHFIFLSPVVEEEKEQGDMEHSLQVNIGPTLPEITSVPEVESFRVSISTASFPRAATVDLPRGLVMYLHDPFWRWEEGWETDARKLADAKEVYAVAQWLLGEKMLQLHETFSPERYTHLSSVMKGLKG